MKPDSGGKRMSKTAVIYQSKYGSTKKYAQWIAGELSCDLLERKGIESAALAPYDTLIYGGGLYAGGVSGIDLLTKHVDLLGSKNLVLFTCGLADPADKKNTDHIKESLSKVIPAGLREKIKVFHLRGAIDYSSLGIVHKAMMAMLYRRMKKKDPGSLRAEDKEMLATYGKAADFTEKETILPLIGYVRGLARD